MTSAAPLHVGGTLRVSRFVFRWLWAGEDPRWWRVSDVPPFFREALGPLVAMSAGKTLRALAGHVRRGRHSAFLAIGIASMLLLTPAAAFGDVPVHVAATATPLTDSCAICHRAHTGNVSLTYRIPSVAEATGNALLLSTTPARGDVGLCYTCHGVAALGASVDVETSFTALPSVHRIAPSSSAYGPNPKMCGSCHDPHGTDRTTGGAPYPALLRVWTGALTRVNQGEEYCDECHKGRSATSRYDALAIYRQTGHYTKLPDPASGTLIRCSNCHVAHGSAIAPLIAGSVKPAGAAPTVTVTANDRTLCMLCHPNDQATWAGEVAYGGSSHAESPKIVGVVGEWASETATRLAGECQVCHAPMGRTGSGSLPIPKLAEKPGRQLCDTCHKAAGPASTDLASLAYPPTESTQFELAAVYGPVVQTSGDSRVSIYGRDPADANELIGPREYRASGAAATAASGDIDGDGEDELVVANLATGRLTVYKRDDLLGISTSSLWGVSVPISPDFIAIGRFAGSPTKDQIAVVDSGNRRVAIYDISGATLNPVWSYNIPSLLSAPSGLASGDVTGTALADLVITDSGTRHVRIATQNGVGSSTMVWTTAGTQPGPRGPSVGDAWPGGTKKEIVVCNAAAATATVSVFNGAGAKLGDYTADNGTTDAVPYASTVADVLWFDPSPEVYIALYSEEETSCINVFTQTGSGLTTLPVNCETGLMYGTGTLAAGDLNGDTYAELAVGNGGRWSPELGMVAPSVQVFRSTVGMALALPPDPYVAGGAELAGSAPALVVADLGAVVPSRHPIDEVTSSHVSTETAPFARHVTCADCHNPHEANAEPATAPDIRNRMLGSWGVTAANLSGATRRALYEYETCFKCHATTLGPRRDIASEVDTDNASVHAVEASQTVSVARTATFKPGWTNDSILYCSDCHGNASAPPEPRGGHRSTASPVLKSPALGVGPGVSDGLCYDCHEYALYRAGTGDDGTSGSYFWKAAPGSLHARHSGDFTVSGTGLELSCLACHVSHGSTTLPHLLRSDIDSDGAANSCTNDCHGGAARTY